MSLTGDYSAGEGFRESRAKDMKSILGVDPAAGVDINFVVPAGQGFLLEIVRFRLVTSAVVANRLVVLNIDDDAGNTIAQYPAGAVQAASLTVDYTFACDVGYSMAAIADNKVLTGIGALYLPDGWVIKTTTALKDGGDNYGAPIITGEVFA